MRNCTGDEGGPFGIGDQELISKLPHAAAVKSRGGERCGNAGTGFPAGTVEKASQLAMAMPSTMFITNPHLALHRLLRGASRRCRR